MNPKPVFIGGCDRSGTTFLGALLAGNSECLTVPESPFIIEILRDIDMPGTREDIQSALYQILNHKRFKIWEINPVHISSLSVDGIESYSSLIDHVVRLYAEQNANFPYSFWIDHTPSNMKNAATLQSIFPSAKFIHIVRDGRAVAASLMRLRWGPNSMDKAAYFWLRNLAYGLAAEIYFPSDICMRVKYEELVTHTELVMKNVAEFIGIQFQSSMLYGGGFKLPRFTRDQHSLVEGKPKSERVYAWMNELSNREIEIFETIAGDSLEFLGYIPQHAIRRRSMTISERIVSNLKLYQMYAGNLMQTLKLWMIAKRRDRY